jgi:hypothetical protein
MSSPAKNTATTSVAAKPSTGVGVSVRLATSIVFAVFIGLLALVWNARLVISLAGTPLWVGNLIAIPIIATAVSLGTNCMIQYLSCGFVQIGKQAGRIYLVPLPFYFMALLLAIFPGLTWPIEGLVQQVSLQMREGLSASFYTFWMALYAQSFMNGLAQICPK